MEPLTNNTTFDSAPDVPAPGPDVTVPLDREPAAPAQEPVEQPAAAPAQAAPSWRDRSQQAQQGFRFRQQQQARQMEELRRERERYESTVNRSNEALAAALEALKARNGQPQDEEVIPDPYADPAGFAAWLKRQNESLLQPFQQYTQQQQEQLQQIMQEREQAAYREAQQREMVAELTYYEQEYASEYPDLAYGVRERYQTGRELFAQALEGTGIPGDQAVQMADLHLSAVAQQAKASGENPVAAMDAFVSNLVMGITERLGMPYVPVAPGHGTPSSGGAAQAPSSQAAEIERLAAVQRRTASAGNAGPRNPARVPQESSEAAELWRAGVQNQPGGMKKIRDAALRDTGGDMKAAAMIVNSLG